MNNKKMRVSKQKFWNGNVGYLIGMKGHWSHDFVTVRPIVPIQTGVVSGYEINWSAIGSCTLQEAKNFLKALQKAIELTEELSRGSR